MIAAGCEDGNDASSLRTDPMFKMALDHSPLTGVVVGKAIEAAVPSSKAAFEP